ncbi:MAG TPA: carboxypeptidase regulatory-like domain-containing protein [Bryobacteraceae bacterium]|jgi:hypothetical protein|nr:carboxypeptidase regulatory-like domain-containing protein [Bryobacteraceae bacterium]
MTRAKLCLLCVTCVNLFAQPAGRGVISGTVVEAASGDAVRKAVVTVSWHGTPRSWATTRTDGSGRFSFEELPAGKYDLRATKTGLGTATYGANSIRELGDVITLGEGETHGDIKLRFLRSATISGTVVDPDGDPVAAVNVTLLRASRNLDERRLTNYQGANTNDRGEYKFTGIDAGEYYLRCIPNMPFMGPITRSQVPEQDPRTMMVPQFFGGARDSKDAAPLVVRGGDSLTGIDFHLTSAHPAIITGRVTGVPQLDPPADPAQPVVNGRRIFRGNGQMVSVSLRQYDDNDLYFGNSGAGAQGPEYRFEMPNNVPGRYRIEANIHTKDKGYYASQIVDAHEGSNDIVLSLLPGVEVKGHLNVEGPGARPVESFTVTLAAGSMRDGNYSGRVKKDGSFSIEDVPPGQWFLNVNPSPMQFFEKSVRLGDKDIAYQHFEIPPRLDAPLNITISSNVATVSGEVDSGGADDKRAGILLEPVGIRHGLTRFYYAATADDSGKFKLNAVAPGKYRVYALAKIAPASYRNPESGDLLGAVKELAEELDVPEGGKVEAHPKLIPEEKAKEILKP